MELRHLRYFVAVAELQNIHRAAAKLHVSQPPLSRQIRDLEDEVGVALFEHKANSLRLTEAGRAFLPEARAVLNGMFVGRQAIQKSYADLFQKSPIINFYAQRSQLNAVDNAVCSIGEWWNTLQSQTGPVFRHGYSSIIYVREGDAWKIRMLTLTVLAH